MTPTSIHAKELWKAVKGSLEVTLSETIYNTWVKKTEALSFEDNILEIACVNEHAKKQLEGFCRSMIQEKVNQIGKGTYELVFKVSNSIETEEPQEFKEPLFKPLSKDSTKNGADANSRIQAGLNPNYTFENYIMGNTNRLAYAIADSIANSPGTMYNPFFLYAGVGLGKTHLIQAIGNRVLDLKPSASVIYCTGERFANELIEFIQKKSGKGKYNAEFRKKYRSADVLIIDDIQFISGKEQTQEEFFHTFNDLHMKQKQIVLASDRPAEEFKNIEERITSRFRSGIMADIQKPDYELRAAILRAKRDRSGHNFPNDVIDFIAENVPTNIRELEGSYMQVVTMANALGEEISVSVAQQALSNIVKSDRNKPVNVNQILKAVCSYYSVRMTDIKGKRRTKDLVIPRQVAMYLMYEMTQTPYMSIGELLGGRDHTTIMHGVRKVEEDIEKTMEAKKDIHNIKQFIYHN